MKALYDKRGETVGWLKTENNTIYNLYGEILAFLDSEDEANTGQEKIITYKGKHIGFLDTDFIRDHTGGVVAFLEDAEDRGDDSPELPITELPLVPPVPSDSPPPHSRPPLFSKAVVSDNALAGWSNIDWDQFVSVS